MPWCSPLAPCPRAGSPPAEAVQRLPATGATGDEQSEEEQGSEGAGRGIGGQGEAGDRGAAKAAGAGSAGVVLVAGQAGEPRLHRGGLDLGEGGCRPAASATVRRQPRACRLPHMSRLLSCSLVVLGLTVAGRAVAAPPAIAGAFLFERDSDGATPKADASVLLTFKGNERGTIALAAVQPGETVTDTGTYSIRKGRITIQFREMVWEAKAQPFTLDACTLTLPFKAIGSTPGPGTSTWRRQDEACASPAAPSLQPFAAEETSSEHGVKTTAHLFVTKDAVRAETATTITILRFDRGLLWTLAPDQRTYSETSLPLGGPSPLSRSSELPEGCQVVGKEEVAGMECQKQECRFTVGGHDSVETYFVATELGGVVVKFVGDGTTVELSSVKLGPQAPALFEIPAGYRKE